MRFPRKPRSHLKILKYISSVAYSLDLIYNFTECGMEFQTDTPIVVKDFSIFSVLENFTEKHWMIVDDLVLHLLTVLIFSPLPSLFHCWYSKRDCSCIQ